ncbi:MBL fold metallo-hydrolase [Bacillus aquiflavi]|uniref:MBL fold metallo-hydrolase n=1 Tax=Bacillus aquiflavi TaxID=2672567 RepID=A0A6B3W2G6_9BACI|nr:MBL fold metallo-hydrolase [Bacillus aquiflavi]MBA4537830.1 MBL fold metallo-hydrolase [Bacillus aquiflavi]NEY82086.1 MBL fold metallo-hydrolase [Bacillus aquiflavi]
MKKELRRLKEHIFYKDPEAETDRPIVAAICGKHQTLIVDAGNSPQHAEGFLKELAKEHVANIHMLVLTHWHWDHSFGAKQLNIPAIAHEETKNALERLIPLKWSNEELDQRVAEGTESSFCAEMIKKEYGDNRNITIIPPNITFKKALEVDLGEITCIIEHVGGDHSHDSSVVFVKEEKVLFLGDCLYPDMYSEKWNYTVDRIEALLDKLENYDADTYVMSHQFPLSKEEFLHYANLLRHLANLTVATKGDKEEMITTLSIQLGRDLQEIELLALTYFVNGVHSTQVPVSK